MPEALSEKYMRDAWVHIAGSTENLGIVPFRGGEREGGGRASKHVFPPSVD
jgi:hypothetical protein